MNNKSLLFIIIILDIIFIRETLLNLPKIKLFWRKYLFCFYYFMTLIKFHIFTYIDILNYYHIIWFSNFFLIFYELFFAYLLLIFVNINTLIFLSLDFNLILRYINFDIIYLTLILTWLLKIFILIDCIYWIRGLLSFRIFHLVLYLKFTILYEK